MFTGIVEHQAKVTSWASPRLLLSVPFSTQDIHMGQSIAVNGCCLTVVDIQDAHLGFDINPETQAITTLGDLALGQILNLERALAMGDRLDGHLVSGHVDTQSIIRRIQKLSDNQSFEIEISLTPQHAAWVMPKGSIAMDGISLTINQIQSDSLTVCIIPHTWQHTSLCLKKIGDKVNIEFDMMAKQISRMTQQYLAHHFINKTDASTKETQ